ncbi:hypothetical protein HB779_17505 [Phyllobacterium sp. 628]|uniref:hypothetical protein n=1 Tax=Phyllobacterium sp. 628 TaxID=2718938 RepID=UPI0016621FBA|nr:hypothetical protein [Phyllobacterium sp. 628]QND53484.1 hypothetical protein HB779_17505 [Phyllobacterium sp. 628]
MKKIESLEDEMSGKATYDLGNGQWITLDQRAIRDCGLEALLKSHGVELPSGRVPVYQRGEKIGTVPATFEPSTIKPTTFLYDVRPGDFKFAGDRWIASNMLGPGDLDAITEFHRNL